MGVGDEVNCDQTDIMSGKSCTKVLGHQGAHSWEEE